MFKSIKSLFGQKQPTQFHHPEFGVLTNDGGIWSGETQIGGRRIQFHISGSDTAPDLELINSAHSVTSKFTELERRALDFICSEEAGVKAEDFTIYSLDWLWEDKPDDFVFEFEMKGDIDGIWRVEFEKGLPTSLGRDD